MFDPWKLLTDYLVGINELEYSVIGFNKGVC